MPMPCLPSWIQAGRGVAVPGCTVQLRAQQGAAQASVVCLLCMQGLGRFGYLLQF